MREIPAPVNGIALVVGVQDSALHIILESPVPVSPTDPTPHLTLTTGRDETIQWRSTSGVGAGVRGRYLYIFVFDPPPPDAVELKVAVTIGDATVLATRLLPQRSYSDS